MVLAQNVVALRDREFAELETVTARNRALAERINSTLSQVQRLCAGDLGSSVDTVEWLAQALHVRPQDLLTPYFAISVGAQPPLSPEKKPGDEAALRRRAEHMAPPLRRQRL